MAYIVLQMAKIAKELIKKGIKAATKPAAKTAAKKTASTTVKKAAPAVKTAAKKAAPAAAKKTAVKVLPKGVTGKDLRNPLTTKEKQKIAQKKYYDQLRKKYPEVVSINDAKKLSKDIKKTVDYMESPNYIMNKGSAKKYPTRSVTKVDNPAQKALDKRNAARQKAQDDFDWSRKKGGSTKK